MTAAFTFPGQGSQAVGMGKALAEAFPAARAVFDEVDAALGEKLTAIIWEGPAETLQLTENAQPALMAVSIATCGCWRPRRLFRGAGCRLRRRPFARRIFGAGRRRQPDDRRDRAAGAHPGLAMQKAVPVGVGAMAAVLGLDYEAAMAVAVKPRKGRSARPPTTMAVASWSFPATRPRSNVRRNRENKRCQACDAAAGVRAVSLQADATGGRGDGRSARRRCHQAAGPPLVSNVLAAPITEPDEIRRRLIEQVTGTVRWRESVAYMAAHGVTRFFEIGAGKVLSGLVKRIAEGAVGVSSADRTISLPRKTH